MAFVPTSLAGAVRARSKKRGSLQATLSRHTVCCPLRVTAPPTPHTQHTLPSKLQLGLPRYVPSCFRLGAPSSTRAHACHGSGTRHAKRCEQSAAHAHVRVRASRLSGQPRAREISLGIGVARAPSRLKLCACACVHCTTASSREPSTGTRPMMKPNLIRGGRY